MLRWRLISAAIIIALLLGLCWLDFNFNFQRPGIWLLPLAFAAVVLAAGEAVWMLQSSNHAPLPWVVYAGVTMVFSGASVPLVWRDFPADCPLGKLGWPLGGMAIAVIVAFVGEMRRYEKPGNVIANVGLAVFVIAYVGLLASFLVPLRMFGGNQWGMVALLSMIVVVKMSDAGAYAVGRMFGRHKLAPVLSPGKTIEGLAGGFIAAAFGAWMMFEVIAPKLVSSTAVDVKWTGWLFYSVVVTVAGALGDLAESLIKRDTQQKDSSQWLPGLGGVLDLLDSILFAAPVAYLCWAIGIVGP